MNVPKHGDTVLVVWTKDRRTGLYDTKTFDGEPHIRTADEVLVPVGQGAVSIVPPKPRVVCLSGSMRFEREMRAAAVDLSLKGHIVTGPFVNMKQPDPRWASDELADPIKVALDQLHFRKIDLADEVVVVSDETGYIGESTRNEIAYAETHGKPVRYMRIAPPVFDTSPEANLKQLYRIRDLLVRSILLGCERIGLSREDVEGGPMTSMKKLRDEFDRRGYELEQWKATFGKEALPHALGIIEELDALRAQLAGSVVLPKDWQDQIESAVLGMAGTWPTLAVGIQRSVTRLIESWAPNLESVPATPEPARDRLSIVAHPESDFPDCLTDFHRGQVSAYERAIEECEGWAHDLDRAYAAPYLDVARWLEGRVGWFRERAVQAQNDVPASPDGDLQGNDADEESLLSMLADLPPVRIRFWTCPVHREQRDDQGYRNAIVEWREGIAHCMVDGCDRTSVPSGVDLPEVEAAPVLPPFVTTKGPCCGHAFDRHNKLSGCMDCACTVMQKNHHHAPPAAGEADTTPSPLVPQVGDRAMGLCARGETRDGVITRIYLQNKLITIAELANDQLGAEWSCEAETVEVIAKGKPARAWRKGDPEPPESVRALHQSHPAYWRYLIRDATGGWHYSNTLKPTAPIKEGGSWAWALSKAEGPLVEVLPNTEQEAGQ